MSFYVISLKYTRVDSKYIVLERKNSCGYAYPLVWAGVFDEVNVQDKANYLNTGIDTLAVPCDVLDKIGVAPDVGMIDGDVGPVVLNNKANWSIILNSLILKPENEPKFKFYRKPSKK